VNTLPSRIRAMYWRMPRGRSGWVYISRLRAAFPGVPRAEFDQALRELLRTDHNVDMIPESNQKVLTKEERAGAVNIGNQNLHLIQIKGNPPGTSLYP
jgi:hypothetical protein